MTNRVLIGALVLTVAACRGSVSEQPPIHIIPDMDWQPKYHAQGESAFFADGRASREPVEGTVARGQLRDDTAFNDGKKDGAFLHKAPIQVDEAVLARGKERFNIYCAPCHDQTGSGNGMVKQRGYQPPPSNLASENTRGMSDGEIYDAVKNGIRNMPAYAAQIPTKDRWAVVAWVRVLQRSQHAQLADVPPEMQGKIEEAAQ